jgi:hypothetical protein
MAFSFEAALLDSATLCRRPALVHSAPAHIQTHHAYTRITSLPFYSSHVFIAVTRHSTSNNLTRAVEIVYFSLESCSQDTLGLSRPDVKIIGCYNNCTFIRVNLHAIATPCIMLPKQILVAQKEIERGEAHSMFFELRENSTKYYYPI